MLTTTHWQPINALAAAAAAAAAVALQLRSYIFNELLRSNILEGKKRNLGIIFLYLLRISSILEGKEEKLIDVR